MVTICWKLQGLAFSWGAAACLMPVLAARTQDLALTATPSVPATAICTARGRGLACMPCCLTCVALSVMHRVGLIELCSSRLQRNLRHSPLGGSTESHWINRAVLSETKFYHISTACKVLEECQLCVSHMHFCWEDHAPVRKLKKITFWTKYQCILVIFTVFSSIEICISYTWCCV